MPTEKRLHVPVVEARVKPRKTPKSPAGYWQDGEWHHITSEEGYKLRKKGQGKVFTERQSGAQKSLRSPRRGAIPLVKAGVPGEGQRPSESLSAPPTPTPKPSAPVGNPEVRNLANQYTTQNGLGMLSETPHLPVNEERAKRMADHYTAAGHNPGDPDVQRSYAALKHEINQQYEHAQNAGYTFTPWGADSQPYRNSKEMMQDVRDNKHLGFFTGGDMPQDHPLAEVNPAHGLTYNDQLRAIHDLYGHSQSGFQFGARGEDAAWKEHKKMFTRAALPALTQETRAQNSYVNFGKDLRRPDGSIPKKGEEGFIAPEERPFAPQHANIPPAWFMEE